MRFRLANQGLDGRKWLVFLLLIVFMAAVLAGCKAQEEEKTYGGPDTGPAYGDLFIDASIGDASTLLPPLAVDAVLGQHQLPDLQRPGEV